MKYKLLIIFSLISSLILAKGIPTEWIMRNGLTDEQIDDIMSMNPNASLRLTKSQWMNLRYRCHRFHNVTNWLMTTIKVGPTNLVSELLEKTDRIDILNITNSTLVKLNGFLAKERDTYKHNSEIWMIDATNAWNQFDISTNRLHLVELDLISSTNRIAKLNSDLSEMISKYNSAEARAERFNRVKAKIEDLRDKAILSTTKKIYEEILKLFNEEN